MLFALAGSIALICYLALTPLAMLIYYSFTDAAPGAWGHFTLAHYARAYLDPDFIPLLWNTLEFALASSLLAFSMGTFLAWLCERTNSPGRSLIRVFIVVLFIIPGILDTVAWILLLSPKIGLLNLALGHLTGRAAALDIYSFGGMVWVESMGLFPLVFLLMSAAFRSQDVLMEEASLTCGAGTLTTLRRITLKLVTPAMLSVFLIVFVRAVEAFEVPALIGVRAGIFVFTTKIYSALQRLRPFYGVAGAYAMVLLALSCLGLYCYYRATRAAERFATITGKGYRPTRIDLGRWRRLSGAFGVLLTACAALLPVMNLIWSSLTPRMAPPSAELLSQLSFDGYSELYHFPFALQAFWNSALLSFGSATAVMSVASCAAWITVKSRLPGRFLIDGLAFLPIAIPGIVLGVSLLVLYLTLPIPIYGTLWILLIAYVTKYLPYGIRSASASMIQIGSELEEASVVSGAGWLQTFRRIILPLLMPGFTAGWIYIAVVSLRELSTSILLYNQDTIVLSILVFDLWEAGLYNSVAALGVLMVGFLALVAWGALKVGARIGSLE